MTICQALFNIKIHINIRGMLIWPICTAMHNSIVQMQTFFPFPQYKMQTDLTYIASTLYLQLYESHTMSCAN